MLVKEAPAGEWESKYDNTFRREALIIFIISVVL